MPLLSLACVGVEANKEHCKKLILFFAQEKKNNEIRKIFESDKNDNFGVIDKFQNQFDIKKKHTRKRQKELNEVLKPNELCMVLIWPRTQKSRKVCFLA